MVRWSAGDVVTDESFELQEYFVYPQGVCRIRKSSSPTTAALYFKIQNCTAGARDPLSIGKSLQEYAQIKRERGELAQFTPLMLPFRL